MEIVIDKRIKIKTVPSLGHLGTRNHANAAEFGKNTKRFFAFTAGFPEVREETRRATSSRQSPIRFTSSFKRSGLPTYIGAKKRAEQFRAVAISPIRAFFAVTIIIKKTIL